MNTKKIQKTILVITDGIGYSKNTKYNAFYNAKTPNYDKLFATTPNSLIATYGRHIGLPDDQMGNSEVGHISIGCGQVIPSLLTQINDSVANDTLKDNKELKEIANISNDLHITGLISDGGVHAHIEHIKYIAKACAILKPDAKIWLHLISDGRDVAPRSVEKYIKQMQEICATSSNKIQIATLSGRFYAMDRDNRFERIQKAYDAMVFAKNANDDILDYVSSSYEQDINDEFIIPASFNGFSGIQDNDGVIFCNFRNDRSRELLYTFAKDDFNEFDTKEFAKKPNILLITQYDDDLPQKTMFKKVQPKETIASVISKAGLRQAHIAESEKYAHVTFFFNGGVQDKHKNEEHILIPSLKVASYADAPYMRAKEITDKTIEAMKSNDFIVINYANGDMVGHCGKYESAVEAVEAVDKEIGRILQACKEHDFSLILTSDHGNCEEMKDENGAVLTNHTIGDVFCFVVDERVKKVNNGTLCNLANSVFALMNLELNENMLPPLFEPL